MEWDRGDELDVRLAPAGDEDFPAACGEFHVPAEAVAELIGADRRIRRIRRVELVGLEPTTSCMPCRRYFQLSYSPGNS